MLFPQLIVWSLKCQRRQKCPTQICQTDLFKCLICPTNSPKPECIRFNILEDEEANSDVLAFFLEKWT